MVAAARRILSVAIYVVVASTLGTWAQESVPSQANNAALPEQTNSGGGNFGGRFSNLPGAKTASGILASSADGMSRYLAPDGPIQPALTAIGGLPMRGAEMANRGISRISERFDQSAQSFSRSAGNEGDTRMPGMEALESSMPASFANMGNMMHGAIKQKNKFIMGQAEKGIQAGERLHSMMQGGLESMGGRSKSRMGNMANMMGGAQDAMMKGTEEIKQQVKQSLEGKLNRMHSVMAMGGGMRNQAEEIGRTLTNGLSSTMSTIQRTGDQLKQQLKGNMHKNGKAMEGLMGSMQGSMGNMGQNMQKNFDGVVRHAQNAAEQVTNHLQQAVSDKLEMVKSVGSKMGDMMGDMMMMPMGGGHGGSSKGGRGY